MKILMFGPAYGHNIQPFIDFFENNISFDLTFAYSGKNDFLASTKNVKFVEYSKNPLSLCKLSLTIKKEYDIIWYHGGYELNLLFLIHSFKNKKTKLILNVWGEHIPRILLKDNAEGKKYFKYYNKADIIQCNWYGIQNLLLQKFQKTKLPVLPWGLDKEFFENGDVQINSTTEKFISSINHHKINFFYPKSFTEASDHRCIIEACRLLNEKGISNFCIYFWSGNVSRGNFEIEAVNNISKYNLQDIIKIEKHEFLPFYDIKLIWKQMDCGLQIAINDQLSSTLLEPMFLEKELIATNIEPYQLLNNKFPELKLKLIKREPEVLAHEMNEIINGKRTSETILENRKKIIEKEFNFEKNIQKMLDFYQELIP